MRLTLLILGLCIIAVCRSAEEEYDYEEEAAAPVTPAPTKPATAGRLGGLLSSRGRVNAPNVAKKRVPAQSTTSKPVVEQAPEEDEVEDEDAYEESQEHDALTTTTETAKKLRNGGVRPFRSNEDLLAALKRRRAQTGPGSHPRETVSTHAAVEHTTPKSKATTSSRSKASAGGEARASGRGRFGGRGGKTVQEEVEETQREEIQVKPKASVYRRTG